MNSVTLQVWYALKRPPIHHPLFRRVSHQRPPREPRRLPLAQRVALIVFAALIAYVSLRYFAQVVFVVLFFVPLGIAGLYVALHGTIAGLYWAIRVSGAIARERERGTFELLSTSPYGAFSASWAICTGCQYYDQTFNGVGAQRVWLSRIFFLTLLLFSAVISLADERYGRSSLANAVYVAEIVALLALALHIDDIHSTVIGSLVGLIVPLLARHRLDAYVGALAGFLVLQITAYALVWIVGFMLLPQINVGLAINGIAAELALPCEQLLVFFAVREAITRALWRLNTWLFDDDVSDLRLLTQGGRLIC